MKVVINDCYGGFSLSPRALSEYAKLKGEKLTFYQVDYETHFYNRITQGAAKAAYCPFAMIKDMGKTLSDKEFTEAYNKYHFDNRPMERHDPDLITVVETLGKKANGDCASLKIVEIPDDVEYDIQEYDGNEWVAEKHRTWS